MLQKTRFVPIFLALLFLIAAVAPIAANAWPMARLQTINVRAAQGQDARLTVQLYNKSGLVQQVKMGGRVFTLLPHGGLTINAPEGTEVFAASQGFKHRTGDLLFLLTSELNGDTVVLN